MSKNGKATTLIKSNGDRIQSASQEAIEMVTALDQSTGEHLRDALLDAYHFTPSERSGQGGDEQLARYSKAKLVSIGQAFKESKSLVAHLEGKIKSWRGAAALLSDEWQGEFTGWALGLAPTNGEMIAITPEGVKVTVPIEVGVKDSVAFLFDSLSSLSNLALFGETAKTGKNGRAKSAKPSTFDNAKKGVETGSGDSGGENWGMRASARYLVNNGVAGQKLCKAVELVASATKLLDNGQVAEGEKIYKVLTGQIREDRRFNFNPSLIKGLIVLRGYGLLISGARQWIKELKDKDSEAAKNAAWQNIESTELAEMVSALNRRKAQEETEGGSPKVETIGGSTAETVDTRATLPQSVLSPITEESKAEHSLKKWTEAVKIEAKSLGVFDLLKDDDFALIASRLEEGTIHESEIGEMISQCIPETVTA